MTKFDNIDYLKTGNAKQRKVYRILTDHEVMNKLSAFNPILAGTIPIEIDTNESDLDIICYWTDKADFKKVLDVFSNCTDFKLVNTVKYGFETIIARFTISGFKFEIFGQNRPAKEQEAYRHMIIENHIIQKEGDHFKNKIIGLKKKGIKTEPAFGLVLGLKGNPYVELLNCDITKDLKK